MKKLLSVLVVSFGLISSTFALGLSAGVNGNIGSNLDVNDVVENGFAGGAGAYVNLDLLLGFGLQAEVNYVTSPCSMDLPTGNISKLNSLDVSFMPWYQLNLVVLGIGAGVGVNFAFYDQEISDLSKDNLNFIPGVCFTVNGKIFIGKHFGVVAGVHGVFDVRPMIDVDQLPVSYFMSQPDLTDLFRKSLYGTIGVEFRL